MQSAADTELPNKHPGTRSHSPKNSYEIKIKSANTLVNAEELIWEYWRENGLCF
jgi:hypothetical protein